MKMIFIRRKWSLCIRVLALGYILGTILSCKDFISIGPPETQLSTTAVFENWNTANAAMTAIYAQMGSSNEVIQSGLGLYGDEFTNNSQSAATIAIYTNSLDPVVNNISAAWNDGFKFIYQANSVIEGAANSKTFNEEQKSLIIAEAKFTRAFWYFYLLNLYGDIPLLLTTDYKLNSIAERKPTEEVYGQIISDLNDAQLNLGNDYVDANGVSGTIERVRPNKYAALALLARVHLYNNDFAIAEEISNQVIAQNGIYDTVSLADVFLKNNNEAIWQIPPSSNGPIYATPDGWAYIITNENPNWYLSDQLLDAFEVGDMRKEIWIGSYFSNDAQPISFPHPYKYKKGRFDNSPNITEYYTVLRLTETYLIRAEARAHQNNLTGSLDDLNIIRRRAGLTSITANTNDELLDAILQERRIEFFSEWGHRWFDLKRTGRVDEVMAVTAPKKGAIWQPHKKLWPIQQNEIDRNPNLLQNQGYDGLGGTFNQFVKNSIEMKILIAIVLVCLLHGFTVKSQNIDTSEYPEIGKKIPYTIVKNKNGDVQQEFSISENELPTILIFWAKWCATCISSFPHYDNLYKKFKDQVNLTLVTRYDQDHIDIFKVYSKSSNYDIPSCFDSEVMENRKSRGTPYVLWINENGVVVNESTFIDEDQVQKLIL